MPPAVGGRAHRTLGARRSIGMHFGTFQLTDEAIDAPVRGLAEACREQQVAEGSFVTLGFGECRHLRLCGGRRSI